MSCNGGKGETMRGDELTPWLIRYAYSEGAFPMTMDDGSVEWFQPVNRALFPIEGIHVSKSLSRVLRRVEIADISIPQSPSSHAHSPRSGQARTFQSEVGSPEPRFTVTFDTAFEDVMRGCLRPDANWISEEFIRVYAQIHDEGWGHSVEVWSSASCFAEVEAAIEGQRLEIRDPSQAQDDDYGLPVGMPSPDRQRSGPPGAGGRKASVTPDDQPDPLRSIQDDENGLPVGMPYPDRQRSGPPGAGGREASVTPDYQPDPGRRAQDDENGLSVGMPSPDRQRSGPPGARGREASVTPDYQPDPSRRAPDGEMQLVGGLYGIALGSCFCAESMFHRTTNASKIALWAMVEKCRSLGFTIFDAQIMNPHLESLGACPIPHEEYMALLERALRNSTSWSLP